MRNTIATFAFKIIVFFYQARFPTGPDVDSKLQAGSAGSGWEAPTGVGPRWERRRHHCSCKKEKKILLRSFLTPDLNSNPNPVKSSSFG